MQTIKISSQRLFGRGAGTYHRFLKWAGGGDSFALGVMVAGCILDGFQGVIGIVYDKSFFF